jgi:hypothetical protein
MSSLRCVYALFIPLSARLATEQANEDPIQRRHRETARAIGNLGNDRWGRFRAARSECHFHGTAGYRCCFESCRIICTGAWSLYSSPGCDRCTAAIAAGSISNFYSLHGAALVRPCGPAGAGWAPTHGSPVRLPGSGRRSLSGYAAEFHGSDRRPQALVANSGKSDGRSTSSQRPSGCLYRWQGTNCGKSAMKARHQFQMQCGGGAMGTAASFLVAGTISVHIRGTGSVPELPTVAR